MTAEFDPYHKWLGIPPKLQPPNHYRLLGVELFESDLDVIDAAANQRMAYLQGLASGEHGELSQPLLNELATARVCLMDLNDKEVYDAELRQQIESSQENAKQDETQTQPTKTEEIGPKDESPGESPPADDDPAPPPVAAAPPVAIPESDAIPVAKPIPPAAPPAARTSVAGETPAPEPPAKQAARPKKPPPVRAQSTPAGVAPMVSVPTGRPTSHARQLRRKRSNPILVAVGSVAAVLVLLGVIYFATGQWTGDRPSGSDVSQSTSQSDQRPNGGRTAEQPTAKPNTADGATTGGSMESTGRREGPNDEFLPSGPVGDFDGGNSKPVDEIPLQDEVPFTEAMVAITNGRLEQARPLLHRVLESPNTQQRTWARQMLEELRIATSDEAAGELLDQQFSDEQLEWLLKGEALIDIEGFQFSYPALRRQFEQTMKKNAPAALERRRADRAEAMAGTSDRPPDAPAPRVEDPPDKPKETETRPPASPAELLENRDLRRREEYWLLEGDDQLRESVDRVEGLARSSRAADTALLKEVERYGEFANRVTMAERTGRIGIVEEARRAFNNMKREYREVAATSMKARGALTVASLRAARRAEEMTARYQELADDSDVQRALEQLGPGVNRLGPTPALGRNLKRIQSNDERLLTDQVMGFFGGEEENVFHVEAIVNDRTSAQFALRPRAEFSLIPEHVLREAGVPYESEWKLEREANGVSFRTNRVVIPSLRLGRFVSTNIEAFVLPADIRNLRGFLADNAFPNFRIDVKPGESVARHRPTR